MPEIFNPASITAAFINAPLSFGLLFRIWTFRNDSPIKKATPIHGVYGVRVVFLQQIRNSNIATAFSGVPPKAGKSEKTTIPNIQKTSTLIAILLLFSFLVFAYFFETTNH